MKIHRDEQDPELFEKEIKEGIEEQENEIQKHLEDQLMVLREEQDLAFAKEIDEHKEIIQRIYDDKLAERSEEIEQELTDQLTEQLTPKIEQEMRLRLQDEIRQELANEMTEELVEKIKDDMYDKIE